MKCRIFLILFFMASLCSGPSLAESAKDKLSKIEAELGQQKQQAQELDKKARETSSNLKGLRARLINATEALQEREAERDKLEDRLDDLTQDIVAKSAELAGKKERLADLISAFIELSRQPPESFLLRSQLTSDHVHRAILVRAALPKLRQQADKIAQDILSLNQTQAEVVEQKKLVTTAQRNLDEQRRGLDQLIRARQGLLEKTEAQKTAIAKQLVSLSSQAKDLRQLLDRVSPRAKPPGGRGARIVLKWPVAGRLTRDFGTRDADGVMSEGLTFAAAAGSPVVAPRAGKVVFAGPFKGYGQILILQHAGGYHSFLAGFGRIDAEMAQEVEAGEPLGVLPVKSAGKPELYFELRYNSEPVSPVLQARP